MANILFSHSYFLRFDPKQWATGQPYPPLGTLYAAAVMQQAGHTVNFFDTMFATGPEAIGPALQNLQPDYLVLYDDGFNYLTKMCLTNMREAAFAMIKMAKSTGCTVIVASSDSTDRYEMYLQEGADFILLGEAELTLASLVKACEQHQTDFFGIAGLACTHNGAVVKTNRREVMKELDTLPFPAWNLLDTEPYRRMWLKSSGYFSLNMSTTRGCPFKCNWCAKPIYGNRYNSRSPQHVVEELKWLKEKFDFDHIWFCDDIFGLKPGWIREFADLLEKEKLVFRFKIQGRVDLMLQEDNIRHLARAGCENVWMGAESGSQKILDAMDKGTTVEQIFQATRLLKKNGIHPSFFIQFGYPGETEEDIRKTIRMITTLLPHEIGVSVSYPLPGTVFFENVKRELKEKTNWTDSDELALMFRNTYQPAFYKKLHRYVHLVYRRHKAAATIEQLWQQPARFNLRQLKKAAGFFYYTPASFFYRYRLKTFQPQV
ncbi:MAG: radical SAM protein [Ferruginibacter sp.]